MPLHDKSRYKGSYMFLDKSTNPEDGGVKYISPFRERIYNSELGDIQIVFEKGMRTDILAYEYYGSTDLEWVILDANQQYMTPFDIKVGDRLYIPNPNRVINDV